MLNTLGKQYPCVCLFAFFFVCVYGCGFIIMTDSLYTESIRMKNNNNNWFKICESIFVFVDSIIICMLVITHNEYIWRIVILVVAVVTVVVVVTIIADLYKFFFVLFSRFSFPCHINHGYLLMVTRFWKSAKKHHCWPSSSSYVIYNNSHLHFGRKKKVWNSQ